MAKRKAEVSVAGFQLNFSMKDFLPIAGKLPTDLLTGQSWPLLFGTTSSISGTS